MDKYMYPSLKARIQAEYKIYLLAFLFIAIADKIGQIKIPFGLGTFILFPIFYSLILGILSGPQVADAGCVRFTGIKRETTAFRAERRIGQSDTDLCRNRSQNSASTQAQALRPSFPLVRPCCYRNSEIWAPSF